MSASQKEALRAFLEERYVTPSTTDQAHLFGLRSAMFGHGTMSRAEFLSKPHGEPHPFPTSLFRAYRAGFREGRVLRERRRADEEAA